MNKKTWSTGTLTYTALGLVGLFFWLLFGDFAWSIKERAVGGISTLMIKSFDVSDFCYGLIILSFPNFTNIFLGPVVSYYSDRHRGKYGRRIPFLAFTVPFTTIGLVGLGFTPKLGELLYHLTNGILSENATKIVVFGIFWMLFDFGNTLATSLFTALVNDVVPRELLGRFFGLFRAISLGVGVLFNYFLFGHAEKHYFWLFIGIAALYAIGFSLLLLKVKEGEYAPVEANNKNKKFSLRVMFGDYFKECFSLPYYRLIILAMPVATLTNIPFNAYSIFHAKSLGIDMDTLGKYFAYTYIISFILSYLLGVLADKFHPLRMAIASVIAYGIFAFIGFFFASKASTFPIVFIIHGVLAGCLGTGAAAFGALLFPKELFAQFNSATFLFQSLSWTVMSPIIGFMLDLSGNDYKLTLIMGGIFSIISLLLFIRVYKYFISYGGFTNYKAPSV